MRSARKSVNKPEAENYISEPSRTGPHSLFKPRSGLRVKPTA